MFAQIIFSPTLPILFRSTSTPTITCTYFLSSWLTMLWHVPVAPNAGVEGVVLPKSPPPLLAPKAGVPPNTLPAAPPNTDLRFNENYSTQWLLTRNSQQWQKVIATRSNCSLGIWTTKPLNPIPLFKNHAPGLPPPSRLMALQICLSESLNPTIHNSFHTRKNIKRDFIVQSGQYVLHSNVQGFQQE